MFHKLLAVFIIVPLVELFILIRVGGFLGLENTILIVILTGIVGAAFAKSQGAGILSKIQETLNQGRIPGKEMVEGVLILAGGIMLITPGFLTDLLGFSLILPFSRKWFGDWLISYFRGKSDLGHWYYQEDGHGEASEVESEDPSDDDTPHKPEIMQ